MSILDRLFRRPLVVRLDATPPVPPTDSILAATVAQLKFLLSQAPMIDAPTSRDRFATSRTPFAYIHPKTLAKNSPDAACNITHGRLVIRVPGSPTNYVVTSLMPENRIIYTPNPIPGIEKLLAS